MSYLQVDSLSKSFEPGKSAVDKVSFALDKGEILCLLGPSGCGKTTLLRCIAQLETPDGGSVHFDNRDMRGVEPHKRDFGMMFQDFALFPHKNVYDNIAFGLQMHGDSKEIIKVRVEEMLDLVDLSDYADRAIEQLSGGEQQRVALARALAPRPKLLMLDEPLGSLDRALRERLMLELRTILKAVGVTAIYVTHDQTEAFAVSDRIAVMNHGRFEQIGVPRDVFRHPASPFVAQFFGFENLLNGQVTRPGVVHTTIGDLRIASQEGQATDFVTLLIRPEAAAINPNVAKPDNERTVELRDVSFRGSYYQIWVTINDQVLKFDIPDIDSSPGERIRVVLDPKAIIILPS
ncbi:MAG: ABC transporter ATP-binding protein [Candidatus Promineifilaceae bacterium]|nr:ABC transporter ATP-binding protein [Candidatus Promineifilaceae bacterium]